MTESFLFFCTILFRMNARQNNLQVRITNCTMFINNIRTRIWP